MVDFNDIVNAFGLTRKAISPKSSMPNPLGAGTTNLSSAAIAKAMGVTPNTTIKPVAAPAGPSLSDIASAFGITPNTSIKPIGIPANPSSPVAANPASALTSSPVKVSSGGSSSGSSSAGSGLGAVAAPIAPPADVYPDLVKGDTTPIDNLYATLLSQNRQDAATAQGDFANQTDTVNKQYDNSTAKMAAQYLADRQSGVNSAQGLGVDYNASVLGHGWDQNATDHAQTLSANHDTNDAWFAKMTGLQGALSANSAAGTRQGNANADADLTSKMQIIAGQQLAAQQADALAKANAAALLAAGGSGSGGGGGKKKSGGGSSSSSSKDLAGSTAATDTGVVNHTGDVDIYNALLASGDTAAAAAYAQYNNLGSGYAPLEKAQAVRDTLASQTYDLPNKVNPVNSALGKTTSTKAPFISANDAAKVKQSTDLATLDRTIAALGLTSGVMGNPTGKQTVTSTAKQAVTLPGVPKKVVAPTQSSIIAKLFGIK